MLIEIRQEPIAERKPLITEEAMAHSAGGQAALNFSSAANGTSLSAGFACYHFSGVHFGVGSPPAPYIVNAVLNAPVAFLAVFGNVLVLRAFWHTKALHSPSHLLLCNMALVDFGVGLLAQPFFVGSLIARASSLSGMFCFCALLYDIVSGSLAGVALFTVTAIFSDKYVSVCRQTSYGYIVTSRRTVAVLVVFWLLAPLGGAMWLWHSHAFFAVCSAAIALCTPIIAFTHFKIYRFMKQQQGQVHPGEAEPGAESDPESQTSPSRAAARMQNVLVFFLLLVCYCPYLCTFITIGVSGITSVRQSVFEFANTLVFIKSSLNPFLMCWAFHDIRAAVFETARTLCRRRKSSTVCPARPNPESPDATSSGASSASPTPRDVATAAESKRKKEDAPADGRAQGTVKATETAAAAAAVTAVAAAMSTDRSGHVSGGKWTQTLQHRTRKKLSIHSSDNG